MLDPKRVWLIYAQRLYELFCRNIDEIPVRLKRNLSTAVARLQLNLEPEQQSQLFEVAMALFHEEYLESYRHASCGEEPDGQLSALQSCIMVEETTGYPVTQLFRAMVTTIIRNQDKSAEAVADILIRLYGAYPAYAVLATDLTTAAEPVNLLPDFCLAQAIQSVVQEQMTG